MSKKSKQAKSGVPAEVITTKEKREAQEQASQPAMSLTMRDVIREAAVASAYEDQGKSYGKSVSAHLLTISHSFSKSEAFLAACAIQEDWFTSDEGQADILSLYGKEGLDTVPDGKVPRAWTQAKSDIKSAMNNDKMDHRKFNTVSKLKNELNKQRKLAKAKDKPSITVSGLNLPAGFSSSLMTLIRALSETPPDVLPNALETGTKIIEQCAQDYQLAVAGIMKAHKARPAQTKDDKPAEQVAA